MLRLEVRWHRAYREFRRIHALPSAQERRSVHRRLTEEESVSIKTRPINRQWKHSECESLCPRTHQVIQVLPVSQAGPCLQGLPVYRPFLGLQVWLLVPLRADPWLQGALNHHPYPWLRHNPVLNHLEVQGLL